MLRGERGDTLIEVTLAMALLGAVLVSSFFLADKAFILGQSAKERGQLSAAAQEQIEALINFRDSNSWNTFRTGNAALGVDGISVRSGGCGVLSGGPANNQCFHMERLGIRPPGSSVTTYQWVPVAGAKNNISGLPPQSSIWIYAPEPISATTFNFQIAYQAPPPGGSIVNKSTIFLQLTNLDKLRQ
jgi:hypothetical protein